MTEKYTISERLVPEIQNILHEVLPSSRLPEGIHFAHPQDNLFQAPQPFIVITQTPSTKERVKAYRASASDYIVATFERDLLANRLG